MIELALLAAVLFVLFYVPAVKRFSRGLVSPYTKADVTRRMGAAAVDGSLLVASLVLSSTSGTIWFAAAGAAYALLRDAARGQSLGKLLFGLVVIRLDTGLPCGVGGSIRRNLVLVVPGANVAAVFCEIATIVGDPQGQRLGDRLAQTQVVEGLGAKDLAAAFKRWGRDLVADLENAFRRPARGRVDEASGSLAAARPASDQRA